MTKLGTSYALIVMILLTTVVGISSRMGIDHVVDSIAKGVASQASMFLVFVTIDVLLNLVTLGGGFTALSKLLARISGDSPTAVMLIAAIVGGFGVEAAAVAEIKIIAGMFAETTKAAGLLMSMFAISIFCATRLTGSVYPTTNMAGLLDTAQYDNTKEVLQANWIAAAVICLFVLIRSFVGVMILT